MKIIIDYPPNIEQIKKANVFELRPTCVFTYGDTIYNPGGGEITPDLEVHEETHYMQQGGDPEKWWNKYLADPEFRLKQEVEAYRNQYREFIKTTRDRNIIFQFVRRIAGDLASPLYGSVVTYFEAVDLIKK